ncbi:DEAD/DEAH box Rna helicase family protein [Cardiosporidium cionae]|uniref:DEAD/DEAH box Rna helicase family protein n=1 Tax=Cardiosporidium cionae TaxID=476202 RepID=A0ABQ7J9J6_9APIC|nr:DEAD/DEAH box Rna helicase family protein [Cardiosporidium cionae]|eukprot:KAF8820678.1 DEAD/DEAH box Rna helicase family protein [Cardiosporidium cionae]
MAVAKNGLTCSSSVQLRRDSPLDSQLLGSIEADSILSDGVADISEVEETFCIEDDFFSELESDRTIVSTEQKDTLDSYSRLTALQAIGENINNVAVPQRSTSLSTTKECSRDVPPLNPEEPTRLFKNIEIKKPRTTLSTSCLWADLSLCRPLLRAVSSLNFDSPTPIQRDVIPLALQGKDILGTAETGSGKTAAFLLPILERLLQSSTLRIRQSIISRSRSGGVVASKALILLPTRELALQCFQMLQDLAKYSPITMALVTGGMNLKAQESSVRLQPDIILATPGRLLDLLINSQSIHLELLEIVVLDEADRLLELGFKEECDRILSYCSQGRQTLLFTATLSEGVAQLASLVLNNPVKIAVNAMHKVTGSLNQEFVLVQEESLRESALLHLCTTAYKKNIIIFFQTKQKAHRIAILFKLLNLSYTELHGNLSQNQRISSFESFSNGNADFLIATELASRGLDIPAVETVINFEVPVDISRYVHRVGRTARMGKKGEAVTLFTEAERSQVKRIVKQVSTSRKEANAPSVNKRRVPMKILQEWEKRIKIEFEDKIKLHIQEERLEREFRITEMHLQKSENITNFADEIRSRPARQWYISEKQKRAMKETSLKMASGGHHDASQKQEDTRRKTRETEKRKGDASIGDSKDNGWTRDLQRKRSGSLSKRPQGKENARSKSLQIKMWGKRSKRKNTKESLASIGREKRRKQK